MAKYADVVEKFMSQADLSPEDDGTCRICSGGATPETRFVSPCRCSGSMRHVHESCLSAWLVHSGNKRCEVCRYPYQCRRRFRMRCTGAALWRAFCSELSDSVQETVAFLRTTMRPVWRRITALCMAVYALCLIYAGLVCLHHGLWFTIFTDDAVKAILLMVSPITIVFVWYMTTIPFAFVVIVLNHGQTNSAFFRLTVFIAWVMLTLGFHVTFSVPYYERCFLGTDGRLVLRSELKARAVLADEFGVALSLPLPVPLSLHYSLAALVMAMEALPLLLHEAVRVVWKHCMVYEFDPFDSSKT